ncbi:hypothetical protein [Methylotenera sp.]|uniref:hypothetical protein n=1 Tax=Methylotenera sp. TaxID=2051956 RepID=UPI0024878FFD|nr:hypothetical protein [Methylotenera sp.]MDI1362532.1 hypothetical protein [Methylotenera sp.]
MTNNAAPKVPNVKLKHTEDAFSTVMLVGAFHTHYGIYEDIYEVLYVFNSLDDSWSKPFLNIFTAVAHCHELNGIYTHIEVTA